MKRTVERRIGFASLILGLVFAAPFAVHTQGFGNRISGVVYGLQNRPVADVDVELLNEFSQTVQRTRTGASGQYIFAGMRSGRFTIRVRPHMTDYEEKSETVEIVNSSVPDGQGGLRSSAHASEDIDIYLKLKRGVTAATAAGAIFVQDVPPAAKRLYEQALSQFVEKRPGEAQANLRAAIEIFPKYYAALERLGSEYVMMGESRTMQAAEILLTAAVGVNPRGFKSWFGLAYARFSLGKFPDSLTAIQKANELNANVPEAVLLWARLLRQEKKFADAEKRFLKAKGLANGGIPEIHWELALLYGNDLKRYADAAKELRLFLKARPDAKDAGAIEKLIAEFTTKAEKS